jgi:hypothetical protein
LENGGPILARKEEVRLFQGTLLAENPVVAKPFRHELQVHSLRKQLYF